MRPCDSTGLSHAKRFLSGARLNADLQLLEHLSGLMAVEIQRYGSLTYYPPDLLHKGRRPLLQFPVEAIEGTLVNPRGGIGVAFFRSHHRLRVGSLLENYGEEGVHDDPHFGEHQSY